MLSSDGCSCSSKCHTNSFCIRVQLAPFAASWIDVTSLSLSTCAQVRYQYTAHPDHMRWETYDVPAVVLIVVVP